MIIRCLPSFVTINSGFFYLTDWTFYPKNAIIKMYEIIKKERQKFKMLDEMTNEKIEKTALSVLNMARNKLLVNMRFLDMALNSFEGTYSKPDLTKSAATDGKIFIYNPKFILSSYRMNENLPAGNYLHSVFHCVFKHMFVNATVNRRCWDLACDIAVESVINDMGLPFLASPRAAQQQNFIKGFKGELNVASAEKIYHFLLDKNLPEETLEGLEFLFKADSHFLWYLTEEQKGKLGIKGYGLQGNEATDVFGFKMQLKGMWGDIAERMQTDMEFFGKKQGNGAGLLTMSLKEVNRERYDYTAFLKKFAVRGEVMKINPDEFDYNFYTYGLQLYSNMPLIEPLEYKDVKRIREFVIAIDTSGSVAGDLVQCFVKKTYNILKSTESFFTKINLHIIQCDAAIQEDVKITNQKEFDDYLANMKLHGFGGTDFRPVFGYVNMLVDSREFNNLKGLIYFTDGYGTFPAKKPAYDTAFVFIDEEYNNKDVPPWAIKLVLRKNEIRED